MLSKEFTGDVPDRIKEILANADNKTLQKLIDVKMGNISMNFENCDTDLAICDLSRSVISFFFYILLYFYNFIIKKKRILMH